MGISERKEREKEKRRAFILDTARRLILERGIDSVSMQDIATACELSKGTLYLYFDNKQSLLEEFFHEAGSYFLDYVQQKIRPEDSGLQAIRTLWLSYLEIFGESSEIIVLFGVKNTLNPGFPYIVEENSGAGLQEPLLLFRMIQDILSRGVADGSLDPSIDPVRVTRTIIMITGGIVENVARLPLAMRNNRIILEEMKETFEIVLRGLASPGCDRSLLVLPIE